MRWSRFHNSIYGYEMLNWIDVDLFYFIFYTNFLFRSHRSTLDLLNINLFIFLFSMRITWPHDEFVMLTRISFKLLYHFISFCFYIEFSSWSLGCFFFFFAMDHLFKLILFFQFHISIVDYLRIELHYFSRISIGIF